MERRSSPGLQFGFRTGSTARGWKSPAHPGGDEGLEMGKGVVTRRGPIRFSCHSEVPVAALAG
jgi:hypothetical protein